MTYNCRNKKNTKNFSNRLAHIDDVYISSLSDGDGFIYDSTVKKYVNRRLKDQAEVTGFDSTNRSICTMTFTDGTRTFSIQPTGTSFSYWISGQKYTTTGDTKQITDVEGMHYLYYDANTLTETTTFSIALLKDYAYCAFVYWDTSTSKHLILGDERHDFMPYHNHFLIHSTYGTQFNSGLALSGLSTEQDGSLNAHAEIGVEAGSIIDEDLTHSITAKTKSSYNYYIFYKTGAGGDWNAPSSDTAPVLTTGTGRLAYNQWTGATWQLTEVGNAKFALYHIVATNSYTADRSVISIMGETEYNDIISARTGASDEVNTIITAGLPFEEFIFLGTVLYQTSDAYGNSWKSRLRDVDTGVSYIDWRQRNLNPSQSPASHTNLSNLTSDDHPQYAILAANRTGSTNPNISVDGAYQIGGSNMVSAPNSTNTSIGFLSDGSITTGAENVFIGYEAGGNTTDGSYNLYLGYQSGKNPSSAQFNTCVGYKTGTALTNASNNVLLGNQCGAALNSGGYNIMIGSASGVQTTSASDNICIGRDAGRINNAIGQIYIGKDCGTSALNAIGNTIIGKDSFILGTSSNNTIIGSDSASSLTTGGTNVLIGNNTGASLTTETGNILIGFQAGQNLTASNKLYIANSNTATPLIEGDFSTSILSINGQLEITNDNCITHNSNNLITDTGANGLIKIGNSSADNDPTYSVLIGEDAGNNMTTGAARNIAIGYQALLTNTTSDDNVAVGVEVLKLSTGTGNTAIGRLAGTNIGVGNNNCFHGLSSGDSITSGVGNVMIGFNSDSSSATPTERIAIGTNAICSTDYGCQIGQSGQASQNAPCYFRSQIISNETWRDTNTRYAYIDGTGNMAKGDQDLSTTSNVQFSTVNCTGKLTVGGLIDPTGLQLTPVGANPGDTHTFWVDSGDSNKMKKATNTVMLGPTTSVDNTVPKFDSTGGNLLQTTSVTVDDSDNITGVHNLTCGGATLKLGDTTEAEDKLMHCQGKQVVRLWLEGDTDNLTETDLPYVLMTTDGGVAASQVGILDTNNSTLISNFNEAGTQVNPILFKTGGLLVKNGLGVLPTLTEGTTEMTILTGVTLRNGTEINEFSTDGTLAGNSDDACPTEKAVKTYVDSGVTKGTHNTTWTCDNWAGAQTGNINYAVYGDIINLSIPATGANGNGVDNDTIDITTVLPSNLRPSTTIEQPCFVDDDGSAVRGRCVILTDGTITFYVNITTTFQATANLVGFHGLGVSYC